MNGGALQRSACGRGRDNRQKGKGSDMKLVVATNNQGKVRELKRMLLPLGFEPVSLRDEGIRIEVTEDGETFAENAHKKAEAVYRLCRCPVIADDSGLEVDFLGGAPGIYSARYAGENATDRERCEKILAELDGVDEGLRSARFICALYCILDDETEYSVLGTLEGRIGGEPRGTTASVTTRSSISGTKVWRSWARKRKIRSATAPAPSGSLRKF